MWSLKLNVSSIQHFSTGDGPGIRTTVFLKGCLLRCPWCHNPETWSRKPQTLTFPGIGKRVTYGQQMAVDTIVEQVLVDREFYAASGGGLTVSGGEPLLQTEGVAALAARIRAEGVPVIVDTSADVPFEAFAQTAPYTDEYFVDIKAAGAEDYAAVGGDFQRIRTNICRLQAMGQPLRFRIPLIPGWNVSPTYVSRMITLLRELAVEEVDLLPFHRMGSSKYAALGIPYPYKDTLSLTAAEIHTIAEAYRTCFRVRIETY